jgi:ABC-type dipeptide/oligopeptide/nickel transport system ATPase component
VSAIDLDIPAGSTLALVGETGSGKPNLDVE